MISCKPANKSIKYGRYEYDPQFAVEETAAGRFKGQAKENRVLIENQVN